MPIARAVFWAATLGGIVFSVRSLAEGPPALAISALAALAYVGWCSWESSP